MRATAASSRASIPRLRSSHLGIARSSSRSRCCADDGGFASTTACMRTSGTRRRSRRTLRHRSASPPRPALAEPAYALRSTRPPSFTISPFDRGFVTDRDPRSAAGGRAAPCHDASRRPITSSRQSSHPSAETRGRDRDRRHSSGFRSPGRLSRPRCSFPDWAVAPGCRPLAVARPMERCGAYRDGSHSGASGSSGPSVDHVRSGSADAARDAVTTARLRCGLPEPNCRCPSRMTRRSYRLRRHVLWEELGVIGEADGCSSTNRCRC